MIIGKNQHSTLLFIIISIIPSLACISQALGYTANAHTYITEKACEVWPGNDKHEISKYLHGLNSDDEYSGTNIIEGLKEEDEGRRSKEPIKNIYLKEWVDHFWNPDNNSKWISSNLPQLDCDVGPFCLSAFEKGAMWFVLACIIYKEGNKDIAYYYLGRAVHCLQDMAIPAHTLGDLHVVPLVGDDKYEKWVDDNYRLVPIVKLKPWDFNSNELIVKFSTVNVGIFKAILYQLDDFSDVDCVYEDNDARQNVEGLKSMVSQQIIKKIDSREIDEENLNQLLFKLKILFYNLAQASQHFPSNDVIGNDINLPPFAIGWPNIDPNWLILEDNLAAIASCLIPRAIQSTNTLYHLFWDITRSTVTNITPNITSIDSSSFPKIKLYTTVEAGSEPVLDLGSSHFKVYEDQTRESPIKVSSVGAGFVGTSVCIVMDTSGSMQYTIRNAREAAINFVNNLNPEDKAAIIRFNEVVYIIQPFTDDKNTLIGAINILGADGSTAFYDALYKGVAMVSTQPGIKAIVALTDGQDNSSTKTAKEVIDYAKSVSVPIYIVGFVGEDGIDELTLRLISKETEGQYYQTTESAKLLELYEFISARLKNLYEVSYTTHNKDRDGNIRSVTVQVTQNEIAGQDTAQYIAPGLTGGISGVVLDRNTNGPIKSATILVEHETSYSKIIDASVYANDNGEYLIENLSPDFTYRVTASALNYHKSVYPTAVAIRSFNTTESIDFSLRPVESYFDAKQNLIKEFRDSEKIYVDEENKAELFLIDIKDKGESATDQEKEALQRIYLAESFASEAYMDSKRLAQLGTNGLGGFVDIGVAVISVCGGVGESLKKIPFVGEFLASSYIAGKNEMVNHIATKSHIFLYQNYNVPWTLKGDALMREAIGKGYDKIFIYANKELATKGFSDAMAGVHEFIEKEFFLGIYELTTANFLDKSVEWAGSSPPVFRVGRLSNAQSQVNQLLYTMNSVNDEKIRNAELLIWAGDTIGTAGAVASGVMLVGGAVLSALSTKTVIGAPLAALLIPLSVKISIATSTAAGGLKVGTTAGVAIDLWSTIPNYVKDATAYSYDMPTSALAAPTLIATQDDTGLRAPSKANMALMMPSTMQYSVDDYNFILRDIYDYIQNDEPEKVQEILQSLIKSGNTLRGDINVSTAQIIAASPNAVGRVADYDAIYSKFESDLSKAVSEKINLYSLLTLYLANPKDESTKELLTLQISQTTDMNNDLEDSLTTTTQTLRDARITIPTLVIIKSFFTPDVIPQGKPFTISALIQNIGQSDASEIGVGLSIPKGSGLALLEKSEKYIENLGAGEEQMITWELEYTGGSPSAESGVNLVTIFVNSVAEWPDFGTLPPTYILIPSPPPTPPTGGKLSNVNVYAYPNPFNPDTGAVNIRYSLSKDDNITIEIYDSSGELVTTLIKEEPKQRIIEYSESWNGRNDRGDVVANGIYFYLITGPTGEKAVGKIAVLR